MTTLIDRLRPYNIGIVDIRLQQFALSLDESRMLLIDVDDVSFEEPHCKHIVDCNPQQHHQSLSISVQSNESYSDNTVDCIANRCNGKHSRDLIIDEVPHFGCMKLRTVSKILYSFKDPPPQCGLPYCPQLILSTRSP